MIRKLLIGIICSTALVSCREVIEVDVEPLNNEVVILSELSTQRSIELSMDMTSDLFENTTLMNPLNAKINISGTNITENKIHFKYSEENEKFILSDINFKPTPENSYTLEATIADFPQKYIYATTTIPLPFESIDSEVLEVNTLKDNLDRSKYFIQLKLILNHSGNEYLKLIPKRIKSTYRRDINGQVQIQYFDEREIMNIETHTSDNNAIHQFFGQTGIYVDCSKLTTTVIDINLSTATFLDQDIEILKKIEFEVQTLSKELYDYHFYIHNTLSNKEKPFFSPSTTYSNLNNALGVFAGYSTSLKEINL